MVEMPYQWYQGCRYVDIPTVVLEAWREWHDVRDDKERVGKLDFILEFRDWPKEYRRDFAESWTNMVYPSQASWDKKNREDAELMMAALRRSLHG
jgi:hypothetical protein